MTRKGDFKPLLERMKKHVILGDGGCILWTGYRARSGYAYITRDHVPMLAHRVAYEELVGPIPSGLTIDHLCRVRHCVNPEHMEPVTIGVNVRRRQLSAEARRGMAHNATRTHCPQGHPYDEANTYLDRKGKRYCRACRSLVAQHRYSPRRVA